MPTYSSPGVYVEDVPPLARPITGVSTSVAGFIGIGSTFSDWDKMPENPLGLRFSTENLVVKLETNALALAKGEWPEWATNRCYVTLKATPDNKVWVDAFDKKSKAKLQLKADPKLSEKLPVESNNTFKGEIELVDGYYRQVDAMKPVLVTSWNEFRQSFGEVAEENKFLTLAVYGFFSNGGSRCWVARIAAYVPKDFTDCLDAFAAIDEISIVAAPGVSVPAVVDAQTPANNKPADIKPVHALLVEHCKLLKDRIAILDCDAEMSKDCTKITAASLVAEADDNGYAAFYCPWITVSDPSIKKPPGTRVSVPPSGAIAGIYARTDTERGVHKAPANEVVSGALDLEFEISKVQQGALNDIGVNCIRNFYGSIRVWGARTLAAKPGGKAEWKYLNVRRFMIFLKESIEKELQWVVFEPNDFGLWQRITRTVSDFLLAQWRAGALFGETPKQAFFVRCDASTNPSDVRELGQVVTEIGVAVVKPAEFVIFKIQQQTGG